VTEAGQVNFWFGAIPPQPGDLDAQYERLGKVAEQLFPVTFRAVVRYEGAKLEGAVPAFMHYKDARSDEIVQVS
jgi:hypothetical protein